MIKNETKIIYDEENPLMNSKIKKEIKDSKNYSENYSYRIKTFSNNSEQEKILLINNDTIQEDTLENQTSANKNDSKGFKDIKTNESTKKNIFIPLSNSTNFTSKEKEIHSIELKKEKKINFKPFYSAFTAKNIIKMFTPNYEVSSFSLNNKSNTPNNRDYILNKLNKDNIQNFIQTNKNKPFFGSMLFKNYSHKNVITNNSNKAEGLRIGEDFVFCLRYLMQAKTAAATERCAYIIDESDSQSNSRKYNADICSQALQNYRCAFDAVLSSALEQPQKDRLTQILDYNYYRTAFACVQELFKADLPRRERLRRTKQTLVDFAAEDRGLPAGGLTHRLEKLVVKRKLSLAAYAIARLHRKTGAAALPEKTEGALSG